MISTSSHLIGSARERWIEAKEAQNRLYEELGPSMARESLRQLSRGQLRYRLRELGAARTEGEGLAHNKLVDTVLLWNVLTALQEESADHQATAVQSLRDADLPVDLLLKALRIAGARPEELHRKLGRKEASELLQRKLLHFTSRQEARRRIARFELELLQDCFQAWQSAGFAVGTDAYGLDLGTRPPDESPCDAPCRPPPLAGVAIADASWDGQHCTDIVLDMDYPTVLVNRNERDSKFDALDADLNLCLEAAPQERHAPIAHTAAERDAKFDALDADLSNCLDDPAAQQWPKENWAASQQLSGAPSPGIVTRM